MVKRKASKSRGKTCRTGKVARTTKRKSTTRRKQPRNPFGIGTVRTLI